MQQQQMPTYFEINNHMFGSSVPFIPFRDIPSAVYDPMLPATSSNMDLKGMGECHLFSPIQGLEEPGVVAVRPHDHRENASSTSGKKSDCKATNYEGELGYNLPSPQAKSGELTNDEGLQRFEHLINIILRRHFSEHTCLTSQFRKNCSNGLQGKRKEDMYKAKVKVWSITEIVRIQGVPHRPLGGNGIGI